MSNESVKRHLLKFDCLRAPLNYIGIQQALNRIGMKRYSETWGVGEAWRYQPFVCVRSLRTRTRILPTQLKRFELDRTKTAGLTSYLQPTKLSDKEALQAQRQYLAIRNALRDALEDNRLTAYLLTTEHEPERVPKGSVQWVKQGRLVFFTGYLKDTSKSGATDFYRVLLKKTEFDDWLEPPSKESRSKFAKLDGELISSICKVLTTFSEAHGEPKHGDLKYSEGELWELFCEMQSELPLQRKTFEKEILDRLPPRARKSRGAGCKAHRQAFSEHRPDLLAKLKRLSESRINKSANNSTEK